MAIDRDQWRRIVEVENDFYGLEKEEQESRDELCLSHLSSYIDTLPYFRQI